MGGEELKISNLAMLFFGAWLFISVPITSAQEEVPSLQTEDASEEQPSVRDALRAAERELFTFGDETEDTAIELQGPSVWVIIRMILTLALCAAAIYGIIFFIKKGGRKNSASDPFLKILATSHLGQNRYAHIVSVGSKAWLLGSSDGGVNLIGEIDEKEVIDEMLLEDSKKSAENLQGRFPDFGSMLRRFGFQPNSNLPGAEDIRKRRERLKGL